MRFDWDPKKAESNEKKHGVSFAEAATAFGDPLSLTVPDPDHSVGEARFILVGLTYRSRLVVVAHAEDEDSVRIISARPATSAERNFYEQEA
ncbi:MAG: BrnT family toxin [Gemmatimonadota bacterium]